MNNFSWILYTILCAILVPDCFSRARNYPAVKKYPRVCAQLKYTVRLQRPICIPDKNRQGKFTEESEDNCIDHLGNECPEFNRAKCLWWTITCNNINYTFPACRLKYKAKNNIFKSEHTWMEIVYTNQFGTSVKYENANDYWESNYAILELHRYIGRKEEKYFPWPQPDFPNNVPNPKGLQGMLWENVIFDENNPKPKLLQPMEKLCEGNDDGTGDCKYVIGTAMVKMFAEGRLCEHNESSFVDATCRSTIIFPVPNSFIYGGLPGKEVFVCDIFFERDYVVNKKWDFDQRIFKVQAYYDSNSRDVIYRKASYGGNFIKPEYRYHRKKPLKGKDGNGKKSSSSKKKIEIKDNKKIGELDEFVIPHDETIEDDDDTEDNEY